MMVFGIYSQRLAEIERDRARRGGGGGEGEGGEVKERGGARRWRSAMGGESSLKDKPLLLFLSVEG